MIFSRSKGAVSTQERRFMKQVLTDLLKCMGFGKVLLVYYIQSFSNSENLLCVDRDIAVLLSD